MHPAPCIHITVINTTANFTIFQFFKQLYNFYHETHHRILTAKMNFVVLLEIGKFERRNEEE